MPIDYTLTASSRKRSVSVSESFFFSAVSFQLRRLGRCCGAFPFARRSSRGRLGDAVTEFVLTHTAVKGICRHIHSPHKISPCDVLGSPFPIELPEPRPVGGDRFPSRVLALCLSNLDALMCNQAKYKKHARKIQKNTLKTTASIRFKSILGLFQKIFCSAKI